jgi:hypothetical protein
MMRLLPEAVHRQRRVCIPALVLVVVVCQGCSRGPQRPIVHPVKGRVTLDGVPIEGVGVSLSPLTKGVGVAAFGRTRADGSYEITSTLGGRPNAGAVVGDYAVLLQKLIDVRPNAVPPQHATAPGGPGRARQQWFSKQEWTDSAGSHVTLNYLPDGYGRSESAGLRVTVKPGVNSGPAFEFHLRRDFRGANPGE